MQFHAFWLSFGSVSHQRVVIIYQDRKWNDRDSKITDQFNDVKSKYSERYLQKIAT
jgi:hypothetical protein